MAERIRYLHLCFENALHPRELPCFRAAVIEATRRQSSLFHNHREPEGGFHYRYPLIQYKLYRGRASMLCLQDGVDDIHYLLQERRIALTIGDRPREEYRIEDLHLRYHLLNTWERSFRYSLLHWIALSQKNYALYQGMVSEADRLRFLERILTGNILSMAQGLGWQVEAPIELAITRLRRVRALPYKGQKVLAFSLDFQCNVSLPRYAGLGKGSSAGFGVVGPQREPSKRGRHKPEIPHPAEQAAGRASEGGAPKRKSGPKA